MPIISRNAVRVMRLPICALLILDKLAARQYVALQDSEKRVSNGVIECYQYLRRQAKVLVRQLPGLPDLFLRPCRGVSLVAAETPFSAARVCAAMADRPPSLSLTPRTEALTAAPFQPSVLLPDCTRNNLRRCEIQNFPEGACPQTLLDGALHAQLPHFLLRAPPQLKS